MTARYAHVTTERYFVSLKSKQSYSKTRIIGIAAKIRHLICGQIVYGITCHTVAHAVAVLALVGKKIIELQNVVDSSNE